MGNALRIKGARGIGRFLHRWSQLRSGTVRLQERSGVLLMAALTKGRVANVAIRPHRDDDAPPQRPRDRIADRRDGRGIERGDRRGTTGGTGTRCFFSGFLRMVEMESRRGGKPTSWCPTTRPSRTAGSRVGRGYQTRTLSLRPDERLVAQPGRALLQPADGEGDPPLRFPLPRPPRVVPDGIRRHVQRKTPPVCLDEVASARILEKMDAVWRVVTNFSRYGHYVGQ